MAWPMCVRAFVYPFMVSVDVTRGCHGYRFGSTRGRSRLVREDDNDRSDEDADEEEEGRVRTFGKKNQPAKQMQVCEDLAVFARQQARTLCCPITRDV